MTVATTTRKEIFAGAQSVLTFSFRALTSHPEYIKVKEVLISTGVETTLTYNTHYTVSINTTGIGGTVTISPTYSALYNQIVYRETSLAQSSDYVNYSIFPADTLEENLDAITMALQELSERVDRSPQLSIASTISTVTLPAPTSGYALVWSGGTGKLINAINV
jgi:hypothetical protein